jgi:radical SAM superfamily enzyme YgiQ (UPF0313 family)
MELSFGNMARVALVKPFTGLNLGVSQLSGELQRAGHHSRIIYLKDYRVGNPADDRLLLSDYAGTVVGALGRNYTWNCYTPVSEREYELLLQILREFSPDLVGLSLTSAGFDLAGEVTRRIRDALHVPVIWGGSGPTLEPERCLEWADLVCVNEGEEVLVELADRIDRGADLAGVRGVWRKLDGRVERSETRALLNLDAIAIPDFEPARTFHIEDDVLTANTLPSNLGDQYVIMTSRGCPFSCSFCVESVYQDMFGKKGSLRRRSVDVVIEELVLAKQAYGVRSVMFYDDVFTTHRQWLREFAPRYAREVGLPFWCYTYPTTTRREDLELLADAGCVSMTMGIQSGSERILREYFNRPTPLNQALASIQMVLDAGILCFFDLITQVEFETEQDLRDTFEFLLRLPKGAQSVGFGHMVQFPKYGYTAKVAAGNESHRVTPEIYDYYHHLYWLALSDLPEDRKRQMASDPTYRRTPKLLEEFLPRALPFSFFPPDVKPREREGPVAVDIGIAQATVDESSTALSHVPTIKHLPVVG